MFVWESCVLSILYNSLLVTDDNMGLCLSMLSLLFTTKTVSIKLRNLIAGHKTNWIKNKYFYFIYCRLANAQKDLGLKPMTFKIVSSLQPNNDSNNSTSGANKKCIICYWINISFKRDASWIKFWFKKKLKKFFWAA